MDYIMLTNIMFETLSILKYILCGYLKFYSIKLPPYIIINNQDTYFNELTRFMYVN